MPQGIQVFFPDGSLSFDMTTSLTKILGRHPVSGNYLSPTSSFLAVPEFSQGQGFAYAEAQDANSRLTGHISLAISPTGLTINVSASGGVSAAYSFNVVYGIY